jgi:glycerate-2-kinase
LKLKSISEWTLKTRWHWCEGGHPLPTASSLTAAAEAFRLLERANKERALIIFLVSGGGSAMIESPITDEISLNELRAANKALINCGASIGEINSVRRAFSAVKGGKLSARAPDCDQITLIVSDVPEREERNVASGPTLPPPPDGPKALDVIAKYDLRQQLPETILRAIDSDNTEPGEALESHLRSTLSCSEPHRFGSCGAAAFSADSSLKSPQTFRISQSEKVVRSFGKVWRPCEQASRGRRRRLPDFGR